MRPYTAYQDQVNAELVAALQDAEARASRSLAALAAQTQWAEAESHARVLAELRRQRAAIEAVTEALASERAATAQLRDVAGSAATPLLGRFPPPAVPWTQEYVAAHRSFVSEMVSDPEVIDAFARRGSLPPDYGVGLDERVIEYPWLSASVPTGRVLDAGSALNHAHVLDWLRPQLEALTIVTLEPEEVSFPERDVDYVYADLRALPLPDAGFDTVVSISTLEHVGMDNRIYGSELAASDDPQREARIALAELERVVAPGGRLLVTVPFGAPADLGWMRVFGTADVDDLLSASRATDRLVEVFRYDSAGWQRSDADAAATATYRDYTHDTSPVDDLAAAARAVALITLCF